ncbi:MAG: UxaA family hydrolase [Candidatus Bathyarchaeia archaeon]
MKKAIMIDERDNVATATSEIGAGEEVEIISPSGAVVMRLRVSEPLPFGHKVALKNISPGEEVIKYGERIGIASKPILAGAWIHTHNLESLIQPNPIEGRPP